MNDKTIRVKRLTESAKLPTRGSVDAIGLDLYADLSGHRYKQTVPAGQRAVIECGISIAFPQGYYGRIAPRSGLALKKGIMVMAGVIDVDYRGPIKVLLFNTTSDVFFVDGGDRIAQLIMERADMLSVVEVDDLDATIRGGDGFGSSGV